MPAVWNTSPLCSQPGCSISIGALIVTPVSRWVLSVTPVSLVIKNTFRRYIFENKVFLQVISSTQNLLSDRAKIFLSWACQRYRADFNYLSHFFPFSIFVPLADQLGRGRLERLMLTSVSVSEWATIYQGDLWRSLPIYLWNANWILI